MTYEENILATYRRSSDADIVTGRLWYRTAREIAKQVGNGDFRKGAGIIAALSPIISWKENITLAFRCTKAGRFSSGHFGANLDKAKRIYRGENPEVVLGGHKVKAFFQNIVTGGETDIPVIDRHALSVALGRMATDDERKQLSHRRTWQAEITKAYQNAANEIGLPVSDLQAIVWVTWRREKGITD